VIRLVGGIHVCADSFASAVSTCRDWYNRATGNVIDSPLLRALAPTGKLLSGKTVESLANRRIRPPCDFSAWDRSLSLSFGFKRCGVWVLRAGQWCRTPPGCGLTAWRDIRLCRLPA
jgi:hypothetical protein